jgi:hypothetical protein
MILSLNLQVTTAPVPSNANDPVTALPNTLNATNSETAVLKINLMRLLPVSFPFKDIYTFRS